MRSAIAIGTFIGVILASCSGAVAAKSCTERHRACLGFCEKQYRKSPGCTSNCANALPECMSTGCWKSPMENKCGYGKG